MSSLAIGCKSSFGSPWSHYLQLRRHLGIFEEGEELDRPQTSPTTAPPTNSATCPDRTPNFRWSSLDLGVGGSNSPVINGYVERTGDGVGEGPPIDLLWSGVEYTGFTNIPMYNGGKNNDDNTAVIGQAWLGYDCTDNILCIAAYLNEA